MMNAQDSFDLSLVVPFPDLPSGISPPSDSPPLDQIKVKVKRRRHGQGRHNIICSTRSKSKVASASTKPASSKSSPISLPKSHIQRTPSELQFQQLQFDAEHDDARMYSRIVLGMHNQVRRQSSFDEAGAQMHPLSKKSLQSIVNTKNSNGRELPHQNVGSDEGHHGYYGRDVSYEEEPNREDNEKKYVTSFHDSSQASQGSTLINDLDESDREDDCFFNMDP